ncbi:MAG: hypothetical protein HY981_01460 [Candidatus Magasanikbacteria bacterium]|nr:hypothetical protein [Candidatus Magasanikbacteria bacterium]
MFEVHPSMPPYEHELQETIAAAENRLATLAQVVGADFGMTARFGKLGGGSFFNSEDNSITLDPQIIVDDKAYLAEFVAGHEGGHRAITRSAEQIGMPRERAVALYKKIGFGYLDNCLEDCADNRWVGTLFSQFEEDCARVYAEQFSTKNTALMTPEIDRLIAGLGYTPKFVSFGSELLRHWATGRYSDELDEQVRDALSTTQTFAREYYETLPGSYSKEGERLKKAKERFRIFYERVWPEGERLVKMDIDEEQLRQLADKINKQHGGRGESGQEGEKNESAFDGSAGALPQELKEELSQKIEEALKEQLKTIGEAIGTLKEKIDNAQSPEEKDALAEQMAKLLGEKASVEEGKKAVVPWDTLSQELQNKLQELFDALPDEAKKRLEEAAKKQLEELDDALIKELSGKLAKDASPPTHEEIAQSEAQEQAKRKAQEDDEAQNAQEQKQTEALAESLQKKIESELSEYDKIYKEIAPLADELFNRIHKIFLPKRHPRWQKGKPTGSRLDLAMAMQFKADRNLYDKLWERKTIPKKVDYCFTLLVDLSGSMQGKKIQQTFRGVVLMAEVLNRLGIKTELLGFQDEVIVYKNSNENLTPAIRTRMMVMLREVENSGEHNQAFYNSDGYCLEEASQRLHEQKSKDSFLVVFSDGQPAPDAAHSGDEYGLTTVVEKVRTQTRQKLIGVGLGPDTEHVATYYPTSLPNADILTLPQLLGDLLEDMIDHPGRYA